MFPAIEPKHLTGEEPLVAPDGEKIGTLIDFWRWAYSDLVGNAIRGALAEYIVACALGIEHAERVLWDKYDLLTNEGVSVEVKAAGYLQTWEQKELSRLAFGIKPTYGWDSKSNSYDNEQKRQSDIYVFCVHKHTETATINPLMISQWEFYLMPTRILNGRFGKQKTVALSSLIKAGAEWCDFSKLKSRISELVH